MEICINNAWGTICGNTFSSEEAQVICRQLGHPSEGKIFEENYLVIFWSHLTKLRLEGYQPHNLNYKPLHYATIDTGAVAHRHSFYGPGLGPVFLDQVRCSGNEFNITSCSHLPLGLPSVTCTHSDDVGVECPGKEAISVLLCHPYS